MTAALKYFVSKRKKRFQCEQDIENYRKQWIEYLTDFNKNYAGIGLSDGRWADEGTAEGMLRITRKAEQLVQQDVANDDIRFCVDSIIDDPETIAATEQRPDFVKWLETKKPKEEDYVVSANNQSN